MTSYTEVQKASKVLFDQHNLEVDILINAAGVGPQFDWLKEEEESVNKMVDTNFKSCLWLTRTFMPTFMRRRSGHIVTIASTSGVNPTPRMLFFANFYQYKYF
jgi:short-subunit dehydrogenase